MQNQINIGDQDSQQVSQNFVNQSVPMQDKPKVNYWTISIVIFVVLFFVTIGVYFLTLKKVEKSQNFPTLTEQTTNVALTTAPTSFSNEFCDLVKIEGAETQFCLDKRLIKNYTVKYDDLRLWDTNRANEVRVSVRTKDYSDSGEINPGTTDWQNFKIFSGITVLLSVNLSPTFKNFNELEQFYSKPWAEPHGEVAPRYGSKTGKINNLNYVYEINNTDSTKSIRITSHFFNFGRQYDLYIDASPKSLSQDNLLLLHNNILETMSFDSQGLDPAKLDTLSCDELKTLLAAEYNKLDFSCSSDQDCSSSNIFQCDCEGVNSDTQKAKEIDIILQKKQCPRVNLFCEYGCKCRNKVCTRVKWRDLF